MAWFTKAKNYMRTRLAIDKTDISQKKYTIEPKPTLCLWNFWDNLVNNNELEKLQVILQKEVQSLLKILKKIGFSKDFNVFELRKAIGERNQLKAYTIAENFANPKENPMVVTTSLVLVLYNY
jgi:DNA polymerase-3 subunit delta